MRLIVDGTPEEAGRMWHYTGQYDPLVLKAATLFGVDSALVRAVIAVESAFNRYARSHKGARGLMQLMPATGRQYGVVNAYDPWQNIRAGTAHLRDLLDEFKDLRLALAAYNAGSTPVRHYKSIPPYPETRNYVRKVMAIYQAGTKIEIIKGDKVYTIANPGGQTTVSSTAPAGAASSSLAEIARRNRRRSQTRGTIGQTPLPAVATEPLREEVTTRLVFYRYKDENGVIYITRTRPAQPPYEILEP